MKVLNFLIILTVYSFSGSYGQSIVNPVSQPILNGSLRINTRLFAQIPSYNGQPSRIVAIVSYGPDLYISTSTSGALIYKVDNSSGTVSLWFDVASAVRQSTGRNINSDNLQHGGLRGIAFHPDFERNGRFYVSAMEDRPKDFQNFRYFSDVPNPIQADSVVLEFTYSHSQRKVLPISYRQVLRIGMPVFDHPVKQMAFFGRTLLIDHGDGSVQSAIVGGGQRDDGLGKVLRINPLQNMNNSYRIPPSNPFVGDPRYKDEIYALGFRNPHNICVSPKYGIFVTDAGRDNVEEINIINAGRNYGWSEREGTFVHKKEGGGILNGIGPLPSDDAKNNFTYPNVQVGHMGPVGAAFMGLALAGSCPIENGSPLNGLFIYANFPTDGQVYYSLVDDMKRAVVQGPPSTLTQASTFRAKILFDHDKNSATPPIELDNLRDVIRREGIPNAERSDIRFGRGPKGEIYWSSKANGRIYIITNSLPSS